MDERLRSLVRARAGERCEYCRTPERFVNAPFQIDHIIAEKHGGPTIEANLAWSCFECNSYKGSNIAGWLSTQNRVERLYHPRQDDWHAHFEWVGTLIAPRTDVGQVTVHVLHLNNDFARLRRELLLQLGESLE